VVECSCHPLGILALAAGLPSPRALVPSGPPGSGFFVRLITPNHRRYCTHTNAAIKACTKGSCVYNPGMVRPKKPPNEVASERIDLRLTTAERLVFENAAKRAELTLSEWIRNCCSRAAKRSAKGS
jgi:hypothetical protein